MPAREITHTLLTLKHNTTRHWSQRSPQKCVNAN